MLLGWRAYVVPLWFIFMVLSLFFVTRVEWTLLLLFPMFVLGMDIGIYWDADKDGDLYE